MQKEEVYISALGWVIRMNPKGQETFYGLLSYNSYETRHFHYLHKGLALFQLL